MPVPADSVPRTSGITVLLASSNQGKLREFRALASVEPTGPGVEFDLFPRFSQVDETYRTFARQVPGMRVALRTALGAKASNVWTTQIRSQP